MAIDYQELEQQIIRAEKVLELSIMRLEALRQNVDRFTLRAADLDMFARLHERIEIERRELEALKLKRPLQWLVEEYGMSIHDFLRLEYPAITTRTKRDVSHDRTYHYIVPEELSLVEILAVVNVPAITEHFPKVHTINLNKVADATGKIWGAFGYAPEIDTLFVYERS